MSKTIKGLMQKIDGSMENFIRDLRYIKVNQVAILEIKNKISEINTQYIGLTTN